MELPEHKEVHYEGKIKDISIRAFKTFWQATIGYLVATFGT